MRAALIPAALLLLAACDTTSPLGGAASYDALKQAQADCAAKGGTLKLKPEGNPERIDAYDCVRK